MGDFLLLLPRVLWLTECAHTVMFYSSALLSPRKFCLEFEILSQISEFPHMCSTDSLCQSNFLCKSSSPHVNVHLLSTFHIQFLQTFFPPERARNRWRFVYRYCHIWFTGMGEPCIEVYSNPYKYIQNVNFLMTTQLFLGRIFFSQ